MYLVHDPHLLSITSGYYSIIEPLFKCREIILIRTIRCIQFILRPREK